MNWQYIFIIVILAALLGGAALWLEVPDKIPEVEKPARVVKEEKEIIDGVVIVRNLDKELILEKIEAGKEFLFRMENEAEHGFYKQYDALNDSFEPRLYTVYSASIIYTFLYINDLKEDERILASLPRWGDFLLSMQNKNQKNERYGAFHYSYYYLTGKKEERFVVGTAALSIFTLLRLHDLTGEEKYLASAKLAGDWLSTMQKEDGSMRPYVQYSDGQWVYGQKESLLYNGQVLSALSKLYEKVEDKKYYEVAQRIAQRFSQKYEVEQGFIEGEYREKNPISNGWVVMSLMDFYKINPNDYYPKIIFDLSEKIVEKQNNDSTDLLYYGSWWRVYSTSGVGWLSEVMVETDRFCQKEKGSDCQHYQEAALRAMRLLIQNTYSKDNSASLKNPDRALGGVFWSASNKYVRTDSVCHALNSYIRIIIDLEEGPLLSMAVDVKIKKSQNFNY